MKAGRIVESENVTIECCVDEALEASVLRAFTGTTPLDDEIDRRPVPSAPIWLSVSVRTLRWYRRTISPTLGQRCVFEPSCSRYAEVALAQHGFVRGSRLTIGRLLRCRPGHGGFDLP